MLCLAGKMRCFWHAKCDVSYPQYAAWTSRRGETFLASKARAFATGLQVIESAVRGPGCTSAPARNPSPEAEKFEVVQSHSRHSNRTIFCSLRPTHQTDR
jgi:hypothetical protein